MTYDEFTERLPASFTSWSLTYSKAPRSAGMHWRVKVELLGRKAGAPFASSIATTADTLEEAFRDAASKARAWAAQYGEV